MRISIRVRILFFIAISLFLDSWPDNCPIKANNDQTDSDDDGVGDACDNAILSKSVCRAG